MPTTEWIDALLPGDDESDLHPCLIRMGDYALSLLARDYEAAVVWLDVWCKDAGVERTSAEFEWDDRAVERGWTRP